MATITQTTRSAAPVRPVAPAPQTVPATREQKLQMAEDQYHATRRRAQDRLEDGFGMGVKCTGVAVKGGTIAGRAVGSIAGAGGPEQAPAVVGELAGALLSAPFCYAGPIVNSFAQQGVMLAARGEYKLAEKKYGH